MNLDTIVVKVAYSVKSRLRELFDSARRLKWLSWQVLIPLFLGQCPLRQRTSVGLERGKRDIPDEAAPVVIAHEDTSVRSDRRDAVAFLATGQSRPKLLTREGIDEPNRAVGAGGHEHIVVWRKRKRLNPARIAEDRTARPGHPWPDPKSGSGRSPRR